MPDLNEHNKYVSIRRFLAVARGVLGLVPLALQILHLLLKIWL